MLKKSQIIDSIKELPDNIEINEVIEQLILLEKVNRGLDESANDKVFSSQEAKQKLSKWIK